MLMQIQGEFCFQIPFFLQIVLKNYAIIVILQNYSRKSINLI